MGWLESLLVRIAIGILDKYIMKGTAAFKSYMDLKKELSDNKVKSDKYQEVVDKDDSTREDRRRAEDDLLS